MTATCPHLLGGLPCTRPISEHVGGGKGCVHVAESGAPDWKRDEVVGDE